jgi:hypothetical protein
VQVDQHAVRGPPLQQRAVVDGVAVHAGLQERLQLDDVVPEQRADQVDPVRGQIDGRATAGHRRVDPPVVVGRPVRGPVAGQPAAVDDPHGGDGAELRHQLGQPPVRGVPALVVGRAEQPAVAGLDDRLGVRDVGGQRLLAQHRLAGRCRGLDQLAVRSVRRGDVDGVQAGGGQEGLHVRGPGRVDRHPVQRRRRPVEQPDDVRAGCQQAGQGVVARHPAAAGDPPAGHQCSGRSTSTRRRAASWGSGSACGGR